jgi:antitoxin component YwqK of YwqJK toxin-antitoxin module
MKKNIFLLLYILFSVSLSAQINMMSKKIYLDSLNREATPENYSYTRVITNYSQKSMRYVVTDFYKNGRKKMTGSSLNKDVLIKDGEFIYYYKNTSKEAVVNYSENHKVGKEFNWYENKDIKSEKENYWNPKTKTTQTRILNFWTKNKEQTVIDGNGEYEDTIESVTEKGAIKNGLKQGEWTGTDALLKITYIENYDKGILISGVSTDENNVKNSYSSLDKKQNIKNVHR